MNVGSVVRVKFNWFQIAKKEIGKFYIQNWINQGIKEYIDSLVGLDLVIINATDNLKHFDLELGRGLNFRKEWLKKVV